MKESEAKEALEIIESMREMTQGMILHAKAMIEQTKRINVAIDKFESRLDQFDGRLASIERHVDDLVEKFGPRFS